MPGGIMTDRPLNQRFAMPAERIATYKNYPSNALLKPEELTRAGFYYTGQSRYL